MSAEQNQLVAFWADREAAQMAAREAAAQDQARRGVWATVTAWWSARAVRDAAQATIEIQQPARDIAANLGAAYAREITAGLRAAGVAPVRLDLPPARGGADLVEVYSRPAQAFRDTYSTTGDDDAALDAAMARLQALLRDDFMLARRDGELQQLQAAQVTGYRRILRPELSEGGVCGLCLAASDRIYRTAELMPMHGRCKCTTAPIVDGYDPGDANKVDLEALYKAAGGTTDGRTLKQVRYDVKEHGELGPVLTRRGDRFQREGEAPKGGWSQRATTELAALEPVLQRLEARADAGENVAAPLAYQRERVTKLRRITAAA